MQSPSENWIRAAKNLGAMYGQVSKMHIGG